MFKKVTFAIMALALVTAVPAAAQDRAAPNFASIAGEAQIGWLETLQPPDTTCIGGEPTGLPFPPCSPGTRRVIGRKEVQLWGPGTLSDSVKKYLDGTINFVVNCNMSGEYRGPCWGSFEWEVPGMGTWDGYWVSPVMDLITYESKMIMAGYGVSGELKGKTMRFEGGSAPYDWYISGAVRIRKIR